MILNTTKRLPVDNLRTSILRAAEPEKEVLACPSDRDIFRDVTASKTGERIPQTGFSLRENGVWGGSGVSSREQSRMSGLREGSAERRDMKAGTCS